MTHTPSHGGTPEAEHPWPVVLLTALGAWLAAIPILIAVGMLLGNTLRQGVGPYVVGLLALGAAVVVLRARGVSPFWEQLAVPGLLVGLGTLGMGIYQDMGQRAGSVGMLLVVVALATLLPKDGLRTLLGAFAAGLLGVAWLSEMDWVRGHVRALGLVYAVMAAGLLMAWWSSRGTKAPAGLAAFAAGWLLAGLAGLTWVTGSTFLVGGAVGSSDAGHMLGWFMGPGQRSGGESAMQLLSSTLVLLAGAALGMRVSVVLRSALGWGLAAVLAALAWWMPTLGLAVFTLVATSALQRWRIAGVCALVVAWVLGAFYYQLQWTLVDKALVMMLAGVILGGLVWWDQWRTAPRTQTAPEGTAPVGLRTDRRAWLVGGACILTLLVANGAIWQKQHLIATGQRVLIPLAPVDPRSLMQGDFMRLRFPTVDDGEIGLLQDLGGTRPHMVATLDSRGVVGVARPYRVGQPLQTSEILLELTPKNGSWVIVTDAWFFKEGEGAKWQEAKFGEFRVLPSGKALLVGMANAQLQSISDGL